MLDAALRGGRRRSAPSTQGAPLDFPLHLPNRAAITALLADLREEERVEAALAALVERGRPLRRCTSSCAPELEIAKGLRDRLGRAVPSLGAGECVCGLTVGVNEHDHERLSAALRAAEALGSPAGSRARWRRRARRCSASKTGIVLEQAIRAAARAGGRPPSKGLAAWDHKGIATGRCRRRSTRARPPARLAGPRARRRGEARAARAAREKMEDWARLLDGRGGGGARRGATGRGAQRVVGAQGPCEAQADRAAQGARRGALVRVGDSSGTTTAQLGVGVAQAKAAGRGLPLPTDRGKLLVEQAAVVVRLRCATRCKAPTGRCPRRGRGWPTAARGRAAVAARARRGAGRVVGAQRDAACLEAPCARPRLDSGSASSAPAAASAGRTTLIATDAARGGASAKVGRLPAPPT